MEEPQQITITVSFNLHGGLDCAIAVDLGVIIRKLVFKRGFWYKISENKINERLICGVYTYLIISSYSNLLDLFNNSYRLRKAMKSIVNCALKITFNSQTTT